MINFNGVKISIASLSKKYGLPCSTVYNRYNQGLRDNELIKKAHRGKQTKNAATKLTADKVKEIKILLLTSTMTQKEIAEQFNIDPSHVSDIKRKKRWSDVIINASEELPNNS